MWRRSALLHSLGEAKGEKTKAKEVVLKMHSKHLNVEDISEIAGLSVNEVKAIIAEN